MAPRIDIVMYRDPDSPTDLYVFVDGVQVDDHHVIDFDPGAGHRRADVEAWRNNLHASPDLPEAVTALCDEQFEYLLASPYTEGES